MAFQYGETSTTKDGILIKGCQICYGLVTRVTEIHSISRLDYYWTRKQYTMPQNAGQEMAL